mmetsp:Transcript_940/g.1537  ORF Transcript_940/g.1537 Transcript_940/m.1537 type:complete len:242 (-) Transcript_940:34-759(-)
MAASLKCLVLNASMEPISVVSAQRGLVLLLKERALMLEQAQPRTLAMVKEVAGVEESEQKVFPQVFFKSERSQWEVPSVIVLRQYVNVNGGNKQHHTSASHNYNTKRHDKGNATRLQGPPSINTTNVLRRDGGMCAYCGGKAASVDHVMPLSRGGKHSWDNVVAACFKCNHFKGNKLLQECGKELKKIGALKKLGPPDMYFQRLGSLWLQGGMSNAQWQKYFGGFPGILQLNAIGQQNCVE